MAENLIEGLNILGLSFSSEIIQEEERFLQELLRWNKKVNLTSIGNLLEAQEKHLLDSLVLVNYLKKDGRLLDMGSGGGLPGIPLAIAYPELEVTSVDSVGKKINFQKHIKRLLNLKNLNPICSRLENLDTTKKYDYVVARALSDISKLIEFAEPLLANDGQLLVMKGPEGLEELTKFFAEKKETGFVIADQYDYFLPFSHSERQIFILKKQ